MVLTPHLGQQLCLAQYRFVLMGLFGLGGLLATGEALADPLACTLAGGPDAIATQAGTPLLLPANVADCSGVRVTKGVVACVTTQFDTLKCEKFSEEQTITPSVFGPKTIVQGWRASLVALVGGGPGTVVATSRGTADSLPTGQVLLATPRFDIDFTQKAFAGVQAIEFREGTPQGALVVRVPGDGVQRVDSSQFLPGKTYSWAILPAGNFVPFYGQFLVVDRANHRKADKLVEQALKRQSDPQVQAMLRADSLHQQNYVFDAVQVLKQAFTAP